ncbi:MAG: phosphatase PAP2 family protein [Steroidobacteraceae bacterium]
MVASQVDIVALLPPPPAQNSAAEQRDLQAVLDAQRDAHARGTIAHAVADAHPSCGRFADVLGRGLTARGDAGALAFLDRAAGQGAALVGPAKTYWKRTRPFAVSSQVERLADMAPQASCSVTPNSPQDSSGKRAKKQADKQSRKQQELAHASYPSGHATFATVCAILLADMVPEKRTQLFARARDFGHSRMVVGAHFPSDLAAGRVTGTVAATLMMQNAAFQRDYAVARIQLRAALGLPAIAPQR